MSGSQIDNSGKEPNVASMASSSVAEVIDITKILEYLPHRYPFLLVDRVTMLQGSERIVGLKNVTFNEPHFLGHFPAKPIMPGVLIVEGMAQTAGAACVASEQGAKVKFVYFMTIDKCKFRKPVVPGDQLEYHLTRISKRRNMWWYRGEAKVDGVLVAEAELSASLIF